MQKQIPRRAGRFWQFSGGAALLGMTPVWCAFEIDSALAAL
jgi:hypothetical protein